jgi:hypothetical protein
MTRQLRTLEVYALSPNNMNQPSAIKHIFKKLNQPLIPQGWQDILKAMNYYSSNASMTAAAIAQNNMVNRKTAFCSILWYGR